MLDDAACPLAEEQCEQLFRPFAGLYQRSGRVATAGLAELMRCAAGVVVAPKGGNRRCSELSFVDQKRSADKQTDGQ